MLFKEKPNVYTAIAIFNATMIWSYGISISQVRSAYKEAEIDYKKLNTKIFKTCDKIMKSHLGVKVKLDKETGKRQFIEGDGGQARQRDLQGVVMKQGDAQQSRREQNEIDGYAEHRRATCS